MNWWDLGDGIEGDYLWGPDGPPEWRMDAEERGQQSMDMEVETTTRRGTALTWSNPIGVTIAPASLCPPPLVAGGSSSRWALLDATAYIADCPDAATTAKGSTRDGHEIQATLCLARPPRVSHLRVHCPALTPADFGTEPAVLATCDGFILFKAAICYSSVCYEQATQDFFVYRVPLSRMEGRPSLTRLPHPGDSWKISRFVVGLLRCSDQGEDMDDDYSSGCTLRPHGITQQHYVIAALRRSRPGSGDYTQYDLHRFNSREGKWTTEVLQLGPMEPSPGLTFFYHGIHKVITLGGGFMGWVDLCRGILICNVLVDHPELIYVPLPDLPRSDEEMPNSNAHEVRDVTVLQGYIKYVKHNAEVQPWSYKNGGYVSDNWTVTTWSLKFTPNCRQGPRWRMNFKRAASEMSGSLPKLLGLKETTCLPSLRRLHTGHPVLSSDEDDVVYVLAKVDHRDDKAFVIAINMRDGTLQAAENFDAERTIGISFTYLYYGSSDNLKISPGKKEKKKKRSGMLLGSLSNKKLGIQMLQGTSRAYRAD